MKHTPPAATLTAHRPLHRSSRPMQVLLLAICGALLLPGCSSRQRTSNKYTAIRASTYRGETLAEYVARGPIESVEGGYKIHAVERRSGSPFSTVTRYPYGWDTTVIGPRIHTWRTSKPDWLIEAEDDLDTGWAK